MCGRLEREKKSRPHMVELLNQVSSEHDATSGLSEYISM